MESRALACCETVLIERFFTSFRMTERFLTGTMVETGSDAYIEDAAEPLCREWEERLERDCERSADLERHVQD